jgi:hypothetical protein
MKTACPTPQHCDTNGCSGTCRTVLTREELEALLARAPERDPAAERLGELQAKDALTPGERIEVELLLRWKWGSP